MKLGMPGGGAPPSHLDTVNDLTKSTPGKRMPVVDRNSVDPDLRKAAEGMEAMFLDYLFKVMRETVPKSEMDLESPATGIYRSMLDSETAEMAARTGGVGLADQLIAYLQRESYTLPREQGVPSDRRTGGTHEGHQPAESSAQRIRQER